MIRTRIQAEKLDLVDELSFCFYFFFFIYFFFFFKQKTAYEIRPRDWSSDVCSSDRDLEAGLAAGCKPALVRTGKGQKSEHKLTLEASRYEDLKDAPVFEIGRASCRERV